MNTHQSKQAKPRKARRHIEARATQRHDDGNAFIPDPGEGPALAPDDLAESLAEEFLEAAITGNEVHTDIVDQRTTEEVGGPFVVTSAGEEFGSR
jgi:hypothetical protein